MDKKINEFLSSLNEADAKFFMDLNDSLGTVITGVFDVPKGREKLTYELENLYEVNFAIEDLRKLKNADNGCLIEEVICSLLGMREHIFKLEEKCQKLHIIEERYNELMDRF